jgi:hypothetical protein
MLAMQDPASPRAEELMQRAKSLSSRIADPSLDAFILQMEGSTAMWSGRLLDGRRLVEEAERALREDCPDLPWLLTNVRVTLGSLLNLTGTWSELRARHNAWKLEADSRQDRFAAATLYTLGLGCFVDVMDDAPDRLRASSDELLRDWSSAPGSILRLGELFAVAAAESYRGEDGYRLFLREHGARLSESFVLKTKSGRSVMSLNEGVADVNACVREPSAVRIAAIRRSAEQVRKLTHPAAVDRPHADLLLAQADLLAGHLEPALAHARRAEEAWTRLGCASYRAARYLVGAISAGQEGRALCDEVLRYYREQGWKEPKKALAMTIPVVRTLD